MGNQGSVKNRMLKIWRVGSAMLLLVCLLSFAAPASAGTRSWSAESIPGTDGNVLGPVGVDVSDLAVAADGTTIYTVPGDSVSGNVIYRSTDTGKSWAAWNVAIGADLVAVAPDDAYMAAITSENASAVYITADGGSTWDSLGTPGENGGAAAVAIYDIAISTGTDGRRYIAVAGEEAGGVANMWYFNLGSTEPAWKGTRTMPGFTSANAVKALAFSPDFSSDKVMAAVGVSDNLSVDFEIFDFSSQKWNVSAGFSGYPVTILSDDGITGIASVAISLDPKYPGGDETTRIAFVGLTINGDTSARAASGIYRLNDNSRKELKTGVNIHSIGFDGVNLVAGAYDNNIVYRSADPLAATPTVGNTPAMKSPGGESKAVVAWAGSDVVAGTSGNESAFAVSANSGETFNDISLIDTSLTNVSDVAVSADGRTVYLATDDGTDLSLWRRASSWERVLSKRGTVNFIVRITPDAHHEIYLAQKGGKTIYYNRDRGETKWVINTCRIEIQDLTIESAEVVYALSSEGEVTRSNSAGSAWSAAEPTDLDSGATIVSVSAGTLLVGSEDGYVAYSTDGNSSWTKISEVIQKGAGSVQVVADRDFATNRRIYAASDKAGQNIVRGTMSAGTNWSDIFQRRVNGGVYGLAVDEGTLYALEYSPDSNQSILWRCLSPTSATHESSSWNSYATTGTADADKRVFLNATPRALKGSSGGRLWAVNTNGPNKLYSFTDVLAELTLKAPANEFTNPVNKVTGIANEMVFSWSRALGATEYKLYIAYDEDFTAIVTAVTIVSDQSLVIVKVGPEQTGDTRVNFAAGTKYYWRVKITNPLYSPYSWTRSFSNESLVAHVVELLVPANGGTGISQKPSFSWSPLAGVTEYRFVLSDNVSLTPPVVDVKVGSGGFAVTRELDYGKTYYWAVKPVAPAEGNWSALANFTVKKKPVEPAPPLVIEQVPPPVIDLPAPLPLSPPRIVFLPAPASPEPTTPAYIWAITVVGAILVLAVVALIIRKFGLVEIYGDKAKRLKAGQWISFAARSFLWMRTSEKEEAENQPLSVGEEQSFARIIVTRIRNMAKAQLLYQKFPGDATLFLYLWSHYGSREETDRYLTRSFQNNAGNVIDFLKCYLYTAEGTDSDKDDFGRAQYDSVAEVVEPGNVLKALSRLYGDEWEMIEIGEIDDSLDKAIAYKFARIHYQVKGETGT